MSNHSGSYMLNDILKVLDKKSVFNFLGKEKTHALIIEILNISYQYDCNPGEILENIGPKIGVCYYCTKSAEEFHDGICKSCYEKDSN